MNKMMRFPWPVLCAVILASCATRIDPADLGAKSLDDLCDAYGVYGITTRAASIGASPQSSRAIAIRQEIDRRGAMSEIQWALVGAGQVQTSMGRCAVIAMLGPPTNAVDSGNIQVLTFGTATRVTFVNGGVTEISRAP